MAVTVPMSRIVKSYQLLVATVLALIVFACIQNNGSTSRHGP